MKATPEDISTLLGVCSLRDNTLAANLLRSDIVTRLAAHLVANEVKLNSDQQTCFIKMVLRAPYVDTSDLLMLADASTFVDTEESRQICGTRLLATHGQLLGRALRIRINAIKAKHERKHLSASQDMIPEIKVNADSLIVDGVYLKNQYPHVDSLQILKTLADTALCP